MVEVEETEEQAIARIRVARARRALAYAPELAHQLRWEAVPLDGRTERGELREWRSPLITAVVDAADELYVHLHGWAAYFADQGRDREDMSPPPAPWSWRDPAGQIAGFRSGTTPEEAHSLTFSVASWLQWHETAIATHPDAPEYQDAVSSQVWSLRSAAGLTRRQRRVEIQEVSTRPCPVCGEHQVRAEFFGEPIVAAEARGENLLSELAGVAVRCANCGWEPPLRAAKVARWLS